MAVVCLGGAMALEQEFAEFWNHYPRRIGKLAAQRAYVTARKRATPDAILAGVMLYKQSMPQEERFRPHPATWLNQGRWMDELPGDRQFQKEQRDWFEECKEVHGGACGLNRYWHHTRMEMEKAKA
jgi:hypothetical protein